MSSSEAGGPPGSALAPDAAAEADHTAAVVTGRMAVAVLALINALVALYLHLWKLGLMGSLACGLHGGCAYVQGSRYGWFLGVDVALLGVLGYSLLFGLALYGTSDRGVADRRVSRLLIWLAGLGVLFTLRLKYGEFVVLHSFCAWCAVSALSMPAILGLSVWSGRRARGVTRA